VSDLPADRLHLHPRRYRRHRTERGAWPIEYAALQRKNRRPVLSKVPKVTLMFWIIKILATTVGETGGDALSMTLQLGYAVSSVIFLVFFCITLALQVS